MRTILQTPPIPRIVPDGVFDAYGWAESALLEWRAPDGTSLEGDGDGEHAGGGDVHVTADNPPRMVFVLKCDAPFLPRELARLHAPGLGLRDEWALAPYAIDDATDGLFEQRLPPGDALWLAADSLAGLFWGLHDWAHFHHHGAFTQRAWTEIQCDAAALAWLWANRTALHLSEPAWERVRADVEQIGRARFTEEGVACPPGLLDAARVRSWAHHGARPGDKTKEPAMEVR